MVSMHGVMFAVGYSLSAWIGFGCYFISASGSSSSFPWRFPLAFQGAPALLLLIGSPWLPYSPRWLLQQGRSDEAWEVIRKLHHTSDGDETLSKKEFYQMQKQLESDRRLKRSKWDIFATAPNRKRSMIGFGLMFGNQFTVSRPSLLYSLLLTNILQRGSL
jgi:MFS family permease